MSIGELNHRQSRIVETLEGSVNVVAGAGTGKTFTLTRRIVEAVKKELLTDPENDDPAGHILAITFTKKAASELKSRVRLAFLEEAAKGDEFSDKYLKCALSIDNAWISTIHGMAGRILRENAIEFNIDPNFVNLSEQSESVMLSKAAEKAFYQVIESGDTDLQEFIHSHKLVASSSFETSLLDHIRKLLEAVSYMPNGLDGVRVVPGATDPMLIAEGFVKEAQMLVRAIPLCEFNKRDEEKAERYLGEAQSGLAELEAWINGRIEDAPLQQDTVDDMDIHKVTIHLLSLLSAFPETTDKFGSKTEFAEAFSNYREALKAAFDSALSNLMETKDANFLAFAKLVESNLAETKSMGTTKMSQSDMLIECNRLLGMKEHAGIIENYQEKFDFIMLDEFQDTDKLQMSLIGKLARTSTPDTEVPIMSNLCTVGDMQQSIYRFRGGDVEQSQIRIESLKGGKGHQLELSSNYRSHKDILDAVELIFSQDDVFGSDFLKLEAECNNLDGKCVEIFEQMPRVTFDFIHAGTAKDGRKFSIKDARAEEARRIARHFKTLVDKGVAPRDMALLLGAMSNAAIYADAIRNVGIECAITTGSLFSAMSEPKLVGNLLKYATNTRDDLPLFQILASDLFKVSDDALLLLCKIRKDGKVSNRGLSKAFTEFDGFDGLLPEQERSVYEAKKLLEAFVEEARGLSPSKALRKLFARSGLLAELQENADAQSLVSAGTIKKAIGIVSDLENQATGVAEVSTNYDAYLNNSKETPGTLVSSNSDFVQILTIHSSKGLEFKHVAVAAMRDGISVPYPPPYNLENIDDETYFAFKPEPSDFPSYKEKEKYDALRKFKSLQGEGDEADGNNGAISKYEIIKSKKADIKGAESQQALSNALDSYCKMQTLDEARRLAYVAMTRARESLYVSMSFQSKPTASYKGVFNDIFTAVGSYFDKPLEEFDENFAYVKMPIGVNRIALASDELAEIDDAYAVEMEAGNGSVPEKPFREVPVYDDEDHLVLAQSSVTPIWNGLYSYSMLAESRPELDLAEEDLKHLSNVGLIDDFFVDDEMLMMSGALARVEASKDENPTSLGTAFHRLAQASIIEANRKESHELEMPKGCTVDALAKSLDLSASQVARLNDAFELWLKSYIAKEFAEHGQMLAEVPFNVGIDAGNDPNDRFVLFGEIDGLATNDSSNAYLIDYKTGNREESSESTLRRKYEFQAKCYSYALLESGFDAVLATFVLVEKPVHESGRKSIEPMCIEYTFSKDDTNSLKSEIIEAYERHIEKNRI